MKRSPPDGVFGDVSVRYRVEEITSNGDVISSRRNDITPTSGFVTIENGVTEAVRHSNYTFKNQKREFALLFGK